MRDLPLAPYSGRGQGEGLSVRRQRTASTRGPLTLTLSPSTGRGDNSAPHGCVVGIVVGSWSLVSCAAAARFSDSVRAFSSVSMRSRRLFTAALSPCLPLIASTALLASSRRFFLALLSARIFSRG